jgi:hypothetical protein
MKALSPLLALSGIGVLLAAVTVVTPFAFRAGGDNAFIAATIPACVLTVAATRIAEQAHQKRALWLVFGLGVALRVYALLFDPLLSSDIYRYIWDGRVQAAGINPYRYFPTHDALAWLRDSTIFPNINRADYAVTIYPPVAQFFFLAVTRLGESVTVMRLALLACEAASVAMLVLMLRRLGRPPARVVAYLWHPLPIWEIANSGHLDAAMIALMLVGLWAAFNGRAFIGAVLITMGALIKPFVAPVLAVIWRPWDWKIPLVVIATVALCYLPFLSVGWGVLGFLTTGYLTEEGWGSGNGIWLLSIWRLLFGAHQGDVAAYGLLAAVILLLLALRTALRPVQTLASSVADSNVLLVAVLVLLSPNYPWYFLLVTPFVALCGNAPTWILSIGALLLTDEVDWDFLPPNLAVKSVLYGAFFCAWAWTIWAARAGRRVDPVRPA